jgi:hypothetical protein
VKPENSGDADVMVKYWHMHRVQMLGGAEATDALHRYTLVRAYKITMSFNILQCRFNFSSARQLTKTPSSINTFDLGFLSEAT